MMSFLLLQLLGKECYDIDIAIDNMLGREFCEKVNEYLSSTGEKAQGIGVIQWYIHLFLLSLQVSIKWKLHKGRSQDFRLGG